MRVFSEEVEEVNWACLGVHEGRSDWFSGGCGGGGEGGGDWED